MKLDRLLAIVMLLVNRDIVQAKELAEIFGVSIRTIYRDLECINQAGIPIVTLQGAGGGVGIMDTYRIDRNVLKDDEIVSILRALKGLTTSLADDSARQTIEKIAGLAPKYKAEALKEKTSQVVIDFSGWGQDKEQQNKLSTVKKCMEELHALSFLYTSANGQETRRTIEPVQIYFKARSWYVYAFCQLRREYRFFKVLRMQALTPLKENFFPHVPFADKDSNGWEEGYTSKMVKLVLKFAPEARGRIVEWFPEESIRQTEDGFNYVTISYPEDEWVYNYILGFGPYAEVIEPLHIRKIIKERAEAIAAIYK
jgi:predicted DNA-binding transcriptional regulator YafY